MKIIREQLNTLKLNKNKKKKKKIKQELNEYETNKMKRNLEKENQNQKMHEHNIKQLKLLEEEMKITCNQLEELEKQAVDRLKRTKYMNLRLFSGDKYGNNYSKQTRNNNKKNKNLNKSMENIKPNRINKNYNKTMEEDEKNKSMTVNKISPISPANRKRDLQMKNINKLHKGLSIGTFPKTNKEKNKEKLNLKLQNGSFDKRNIKEKNKKNVDKYINKNVKSINKK